MGYPLEIRTSESLAVLRAAARVRAVHTAPRDTPEGAYYAELSQPRSAAETTPEQFHRAELA